MNPEIKRVPTRYRNPLSKFKVIRSSACINCRTCVQVCPHGVHQARGEKILPPLDNLCHGFACRDKEYFCVNQCPAQALKVALNPVYEVLGDFRWTADLLLSTWHMAETGRAPENGLEYQFGNSGGGFDRMEIILSEKIVTDKDKAGISTAISLNRRRDGRPEIDIPIPVYGEACLSGPSACPPCWPESGPLPPGEAFAAPAKAASRTS